MSHDPAGSSPGIGIPQLAACLLIGYLFFRWYSSTPPPPNAPAPTPPAASRRPTAHELARLQQRAEVVRGMFPQISLSAIKWELQKNGGSVEITTEKILAQGFLPEASSLSFRLQLSNAANKLFFLSHLYKKSLSRQPPLPVQGLLSQLLPLQDRQIHPNNIQILLRGITSLRNLQPLCRHWLGRGMHWIEGSHLRGAKTRPRGKHCCRSAEKT